MKLVETLLKEDKDGFFPMYLISITNDKGTLFSINVESKTLGDTEWEWEAAVHFPKNQGDQTRIYVCSTGRICGNSFRKYFKGYIQRVIETLKDNNPQELLFWEDGQRDLVDLISGSRDEWISSGAKSSVFNLESSKGNVKTFSIERIL